MTSAITHVQAARCWSALPEATPQQTQRSLEIRLTSWNAGQSDGVVNAALARLKVTAQPVGRHEGVWWQGEVAGSWPGRWITSFYSWWYAGSSNIWPHTQQRRSSRNLIGVGW